ncbi:MAG: helix-turn-helix transcriptional regulator [Alphaproteobacteria bacterium]|jgi:DNA-binding Xre family transcriptional regulator|nr:helix-turn-helix transcriptional regulator [Alphaproteobacteria bacterium]MBP9877656.1 helix-turn-helix transcriptional regulator [Alphaproteobacteria bacterium]
MTTNKFDKYLQQRLKKEDIQEIEAFAQHEYRTLKSLQEGVSAELTTYMAEKKIGFNELVRRLNMSPSQVSKIQKGEANLTLSTISHIFTILDRRPTLVFKSK